MSSGNTINKSGKSVKVQTKGRHDPCVGLRATPIAEAMVAITLMDHFLRNRAQNADVKSKLKPIKPKKVMSSKTLYDKLWDAHHVAKRDDGSSLIYIDRHLIHEVTSPQAFDGLRERKIELWRVDSIIATPDHNVPTENRAKGLKGIRILPASYRS